MVCWFKQQLLEAATSASSDVKRHIAASMRSLLLFIWHWMLRITTSCFMQLAHLRDLCDIPLELIIKSHQTGMPLIACDSYTRAEKGSLGVLTNGHGEKRQITVTPSNTAASSGLLLGHH